MIIVGAGAMGMSSGYYLSEKGLKVLMVDAYDPPHAHGSHGGDTRLIRHAVGEGLHYIPLALRSQEMWNELQEHSEDEIFRETGIINFGYEGSEFLANTIEGAREYGLEIETLTQEEIRERWPDMQGEDLDIGYYEEKGGVIMGENAIRTYRRLALQNGAKLLIDTPVKSIHPEEDKVTVKTEHDTFTGDQIILSAGGWTGRFLKDLGLDLKLQPSRRTIAWFEADEAFYSSDNFPGFIGRTRNGAFYGFPSIDGTGVKIGRFNGDSEDDDEPENMDKNFGAYEKDEENLRNFLGEYMKEANGKLNRGVACIFNNTPDEDFIIDRHPEHENILIAGGFSGHGFKYVPVIGEIFTQLITEGETEHDISEFSITREALYEKKGSAKL
ncbi:N-methyl-L-tryptophan oxidase [Salinicoccus halitifaciens]|uniref:Monomeric sarcosine oxidase n=1 Tax=Salinicoccus halitifaciens TaxID=1073415 RepID=A0ABV2ECZ0_9STAP|nr:N-methyl-L-tryptophan oxidase [Salinicoccus halitifaciens]